MYARPGSKKSSICAVATEKLAEKVGVGDCVRVTDEVAVCVHVRVRVRVLVGVRVSVRLLDGVGVNDGVSKALGVSDGVTLDVGDGVCGLAHERKAARTATRSVRIGVGGARPVATKRVRDYAGFVGSPQRRARSSRPVSESESE